MRRRISPIAIALCTVLLGASVGHAKTGFNALGVYDVPELQGFGGVALLTVLGSVGYGARKIYQKIARRDRQ